MVTTTLDELMRPLRQLPERLAAMDVLTKASDPLKKAAGRIAPPASPLNTALAGTQLGHPLHPLLTDIVIGSWTSAVVLDWVGGRKSQKGADRLIALGILSSLPTVASGVNDWTTLGKGDQRVGAAHAGANAVGAVMFGASLVARRRKHRLRGRLLALAGTVTVALGGYLGGDLAYRRSSGVDQTAVYEGEADWTPVAEDAEVHEGQTTVARLGDMDVMLTRDGGEIRALADRCAHQGGPLHQGELRDGCVICPWHQSRFRLSDGAALSGPTAHPQPLLHARVQGSKIELRREL